MAKRVRRGLRPHRALIRHIRTHARASDRLAGFVFFASFRRTLGKQKQLVVRGRRPPPRDACAAVTLLLQGSSCCAGAKILNRRGWCKRSTFLLVSGASREETVGCALVGRGRMGDLLAHVRYRLGHRPVDARKWSCARVGSMYSQATTSLQW